MLLFTRDRSMYFHNDWTSMSRDDHIVLSLSYSSPELGTDQGLGFNYSNDDNKCELYSTFLSTQRHSDVTGGV